MTTLLLSLSLSLLAATSAQTTERISVDSNGAEADDTSSSPSMSANGRFVAFGSNASNLVSGDSNAQSDIFVHDRVTGITERISVTSSGAQASGGSNGLQISANGRFVLFTSWADDLVSGDQNGYPDVFLHDRQTGMTSLVNRNSNGVPANGVSISNSISANGRYVSFSSSAGNLVVGDTNGLEDVFVRDLWLGETIRISVSSSGVESNNWSRSSKLSADGKVILFTSWASNLDPADTNSMWDVYVHDRRTGITRVVSVNSRGALGDATASIGYISADGRFISFSSRASNMVAGDTNGLTDTFVHELETGITRRVSLSSSGIEANDVSSGGSFSADGRFVAFQSEATNLIASDLNVAQDIFLHDRLTGITTRVNLDTLGGAANDASFGGWISPGGSLISFTTIASNLVPNDWNFESDVFLHDRGLSADNNTILLTGPFLATAGQSMELNWYAAPAASDYFLLLSKNITGSVFSGHNFDLGAPVQIVATGINSAEGEGSFTQGVIPLSAAGFTFHFEVAARDSSQQFFDSIVQAVEVH